MHPPVELAAVAVPELHVGDHDDVAIVEGARRAQLERLGMGTAKALDQIVGHQIGRAPK